MALASALATSSPLASRAVTPSGRPRGWSRRPRQKLDRSADLHRERSLFLRYHRDGDLDARRQLIERYLPLARSLARRYDRRGDSADDLLQVASVGLIKAIDRFDPERGLSFSSYGVPTILGELRRHFRDCSWALHVPRDMQERVLKINAAVERLSGELGHSPSPPQVAAELNLTVEEVLEAFAASDAHDAASLDTPLRTADGEARAVADTLGEKDRRFELIDGRVSIGPALKGLPQRQRQILHLRFVEDLTQTEIAQRIGISQMHVSRLIRQALEQAHVDAA
jgi:RNA polymerase sigma-B factor